MCSGPDKLAASSCASCVFSLLCQCLLLSEEVGQSRVQPPYPPPPPHPPHSFDRPPPPSPPPPPTYPISDNLHTSPFALRRNNSTPFRSECLHEEPNGLHCLQPGRKSNQKWPKPALAGCFGTLLVGFLQEITGLTV
jgi:hypothetical protein